MREIGLLPIINIVFMLLIFFLVAGKIQTVDVLPVELPFAEKTDPVGEGKLVIVLGKREEILANDDYLTSLNELRAWAKKTISPQPERPITLKADANAEAGRVLDVMQVLKEAGGTNLSLATQAP
ncbi:MAG: biopolymer transporter ExbD [Rickettsiales bacterium]|nr:biopolymer transporter ExbD [Rickettsiales bacterium]